MKSNPKRMISLILCVLLSGCIKSNFFRKDDDQGRDDANGTYYSGAGASNPIQKVNNIVNI